jgi:predicted RNase H-like HicB family nuclease
MCWVTIESLTAVHQEGLDLEGCSMSKRLTAIIQAEPPGFVALCPEVDVASQGDTIERALANLREAVELFYECASAEEISAREGGDVYITQLEVSVE